MPGQPSSRSSSARERVDVEVVGRLVEQQHVRLGHQQPHELQPAALAAGEVAHERPRAARRGSRSARPAARRSARAPSPSVARPRTSSSASSTRRWPGISAVSCERCASRTVSPRSTAPASGASVAGQQPHQRRLARAVDADERDPVARAEPPRDVAQQRPAAERDRDARRRRAPCRRGGRSRSAAARRVSRGSGSSAMSALAASMRNFGFAVRAGGPRRSQASSLRRSFWRRSSRTAATGARARRGRGRRPRSRPRTGARRRRRPPRSRCRPRRGTSGRASRRASEPRRAARWRASQSTPSTSRWFVGSSSSRSSGPSSSSRASAIAAALAARQRRDRRVEALREARQRDAAEQAVEHPAERRVARPLVVGAAADELVADGARRNRGRRPGRAARAPSAARG